MPYLICLFQVYLKSDKVTFNRCTKKSRHQEVVFDSTPSYLCQWMVQHKNPLLRLEYEHEPVEVFIYLFIYLSIYLSFFFFLVDLDLIQI